MVRPMKIMLILSLMFNFYFSTQTSKGVKDYGEGDCHAKASSGLTSTSKPRKSFFSKTKTSFSATSTACSQNGIRSLMSPSSYQSQDNINCDEFSTDTSHDRLSSHKPFSKSRETSLSRPGILIPHKLFSTASIKNPDRSEECSGTAINDAGDDAQFTRISGSSPTDVDLEEGEKTISDLTGPINSSQFPHISLIHLEINKSCDDQKTAHKNESEEESEEDQTQLIEYYRNFEDDVSKRI